ncbi:nucleoid occlusion factor SlmA [Rhodoferax sp.]|jgi:TetR/AcrR family transcriptional regulator|uniref:nucleoid occlusion factor SlmA n=1 Tax=Rhodoferax sp. TaxID=50421 RepID=UPI0037837E25
MPAQLSQTATDVPSNAGALAGRKRPKPGERRVQILQMLASMLEQPAQERITTAALAARLDVSEAALYRHFASKAQMFEGLLEFIEQSVFTLINHIVSREDPEASRGLRQASAIVTMLVQFAEKNPGMARVMVGDALVFESDRLQQRMNQFFDKVEAALKQCMREDAVPDAGVRAAVLNAFLVGRLQRYVRSGFRQRASDQLDASLALILRIQA